MKRVEGSYAYYYNHKYDRTGTLFQARYKSESVDDDAYFAVVLRYIIQNPLKAGISAVEEYPWCSFRELIQTERITASAFIKSYFGGKAEALQYLLTPNEDVCMEYPAPPVSEAAAKEIICHAFGISSGTEPQQYEREQHDEAIRLLKSKGPSVRQIERLTGVNRGIIRRV